MENIQPNSNQQPQTTAARPKYWIPLLFLVVGLLAGYGLGWQAQRKPAALEPAIFSSFDDCVNNNGVSLISEFNACVAPNPDDDTSLWLQYSAQNLPRLTERKTTPQANVVENVDKITSTGLVEFLEFDDTGCERGRYRFIKEVPDRFAQMNYGCAGDEVWSEGAQIIAIKLADGWALISPTNHMAEDGTPSCLMVDMFKISKDLSDKCFENTGYNDDSIRSVEYP